MKQEKLSWTEGDLCWKQCKQFPDNLLQPAKQAIGSKTVNFPICTFTEFDPLKCVIVGYIDETAYLTHDYIEPGQEDNVLTGPIPKEMIDQGQKDLDNLAIQLERIGVEVVRVGKKDWSKPFKVHNQLYTPGFFCFSPRDLPFLYHNSMYIFPTFCVSRLEQQQAFIWIEKQLTENHNSKIYRPWKSLSKSYRYITSQLTYSYKKQTQYFGDAANLLKIGFDILFLISAGASLGCYNIFKDMMERRYGSVVRVHPLIDIYKGIHVDTTITLVGFNKKVKKYIVVVDGIKLSNPTKIPAIFRGKNWTVIQFSKYGEEFYHPDYDYISTQIGMNFVMVNSQTAIVSETQLQLQKTLNFYGIKTLNLKNKYTRQLAGGFHCATNDINRQDVHQFGKVLQQPLQTLQNLSIEEQSGLFDSQLLKFLKNKGKIQQWVQICNQNNIFASYLTDHLTEQQKRDMLACHENFIKNYMMKKQLKID